MLSVHAFEEAIAAQSILVPMLTLSLRDLMMERYRHQPYPSVAARVSPGMDGHISDVVLALLACGSRGAPSPTGQKAIK